MRVVPLLIVSCSMGMAVLLACDDVKHPPTPRPFEGILRFDERCQIVGGDSTDFWPRPSDVDTCGIFVCGPANHSLEGACPNPAQGATWIHFQISETDSVWILVYDRTNSPPIDTLWAQRTPRGSLSFRWNSPGAPGIYRVQMQTETGFRSHGDVEFTP